jgi:carbon monoxide dehydrogenase subunit G
MKIESTQQLSASRERIYSALTDPEVLQRCIPGCESLKKTEAGHFEARLKAGIGAIKGSFQGNVHLEDMRPPEHYRIVVQGKGVIGFAKGSADFDLADQDGGTLITYAGELQVGGTIASVGQRMIEGAAKMMATKFFTALEKETSDPAVEPPE